MCKACGTGWPEAANQCWVCPGKEFVPFQAPSLPTSTTCSLWRASRPGSSSGMGEAWPQWYPGAGRPQPGGRHDPGRAPPKTDTAEEITMADVVPLNRRVDIRQEILSMEADDESGSARRSRSRCSGPCRRQRLRASSSTTRKSCTRPWEPTAAQGAGHG